LTLDTILFIAGSISC